MRKLFLTFLLFFGACSSYLAPPPNKSEWPFGALNKVKMYEISLGKINNNRYIEVTDTYPFDSFKKLNLTKKEIITGKVWFKSFGAPYYGFTYIDEWEGVETTNATYMRFFFNEDKTRLYFDVPNCPHAMNSGRCEFSTSENAWHELANHPARLDLKNLDGLWIASLNTPALD